MQRIDLFGFYTLGKRVHPASELRKPQITINKLTTSDLFLRLLINPPHAPLALPLASVAANDVLEAQGHLSQRYSMEILSAGFKPEGEDHFLDAAIKGAEDSVLAFEAVLEKELLTAQAFFISQKGAYNTYLLMEHAEAAISESARSVLPEHAIKDFREAGRCLALEISTGCGFHVTRAVEAVLREWHSLVVPKPSREDSDKIPSTPGLRWVRLEQDLIKNGAQRSVVGVLAQIRELHRNPIMHPEVFLSVEEAMSLFDISKSAIEAMAREIAKFKAEKHA